MVLRYTTGKPKGLPKFGSHLGIGEMFGPCLSNDHEVVGRPKRSSVPTKYLPDQPLDTITNDGVPNAGTHGNPETRNPRWAPLYDDDEVWGMAPPASSLYGKEFAATTESSAFRKGFPPLHRLIPAAWQEC